MIFTETELGGAYIIDPELLEDERGAFARVFCASEFQAKGLAANFPQCSISTNRKKGTLRGLHYQIEPCAETKLVRCTMGTLYDVIVDLRPDSPTFKQWTACELSAENRKTLYIPKGFAHGYQTLADNTEVFYQISEFFAPGYSRGIRWDDPAFKISWPSEEKIISLKDKKLSDFQE